MMNKKSITFFFFFLTGICHGQYIFQSLKQKDGLSSRETRSLFKDKEGYLWVGAVNGLNRFDGNTFKVFNHSSPGFPADLGETVYCITEHGKNKIWFGTNAGIGVLDKATQEIRKVTVVNSSSADNDITGSQILHDKNNRLWISTLKGIYIEQNNSLVKASQVFPFAKDLDSVACYHAAFTYDSIHNYFWFGTKKGLYGLDLDNKQLYSYKNNPNHLPIFNDKPINSLAIDKKMKNLWFSTPKDGILNHFDLSNGQLKTITRINNNPEWLLGGGCIRLFFDVQDRLWVSTWLYTSFVKYPDGRFEKIVYNKDITYSIGYGSFVDALQEENGSLWFATINGVSKLSSSNYIDDIIVTPNGTYPYNVGFSNLNEVKIGTDGSWWMAKYDGLWSYDSATRKFETYRPVDATLGNHAIVHIYLINGEWWCTMNASVWIFNPQKKQFRRFNNFPGIKPEDSKYVNWIAQQKNGTIWLAVLDKGVFCYNPETNECVHVEELKNFPENFKTRRSRFIYETNKGKIWISEYGKGHIIYDVNAGTFSKPESALLRGPTALGIAEDAQHYLWFSIHNRGLYKSTPEGSIVDSITEKDGLPENRIDKICIDPSGKIWCVIERESLLCINPATKKITPIKAEIDFSFNEHWMGLEMVGHRLFTTMLDKLVIINTNNFQPPAHDKGILLSGFSVFQEEIPFNIESVVELKYRQNFFSINFSSPSHLENPSMQYAYKLEGFDKDWIYCGRSLTAAYTNVPSGSYTFMIKSTTGNGVWDDNVTKLRIHIQAPFWKTWWFISSLVLLSVITSWQLYKRILNRRKKKSVERTIDYFANSVYGENSVNEICWDIARNCISQLHFQDCVVYLVDEEKNKLVQKAAYGPKNPKGHEIINPIEIENGKGIVGVVAATGKSLLINDTSKDERYIVDDEMRYSELAVPILHNNKVIGVIDSEHSSKNYFTEEHVKALSTIAAISANKIAEATAEALAKENEIKVLEINKMLAESQLMALRAQMNPHFVFNCLNSIQECIVTEKYGEASKYLNKFSKLFRMVLNNSGKKLVSLAEEKEVLELYLELEQMRFEKSFSYEIIMDEELDEDEILIPSMLIQPYVENALWHGLMHKEGERNLKIEFRQLNDNVFSCVVEDNGIGRKKSFELKAGQSKAKRHESKGLAISKDRLDVLQRQGYHTTLQIIDKKDNNSNADGTKIIIELSTDLTN